VISGGSEIIIVDEFEELEGFDEEIKKEE